VLGGFFRAAVAELACFQFGKDCLFASVQTRNEYTGAPRTLKSGDRPFLKLLKCHVAGGWQSVEVHAVRVRLFLPLCLCKLLLSWVDDGPPLRVNTRYRSRCQHSDILLLGIILG